MDTRIALAWGQKGTSVLLDRLIFAVLLCIGLSIAPAFAEEGHPPPLKCEVGPLKRTYGQTPWLVYACEDGRSIVVVTDTGSPAMPFYFFFFVTPDDDMQLHGEGEGDKTATQAAFDDLAKLTREDVAALVEEARNVGGKNQAKRRSGNR